MNPFWQTIHSALAGLTKKIFDVYRREHVGCRQQFFSLFYLCFEVFELMKFGQLRVFCSSELMIQKNWWPFGVASETYLKQKSAQIWRDVAS